MLYAILEILLSLLAVYGLLCLGWLLFRRLLAPEGPCSPVYAVVPALGGGETLEQTVRGLLWMRAGDLTRYTLVIADAGLDSQGLMLAELLAKQTPGVVLCPLDSLPGYLM